MMMVMMMMVLLDVQYLVIFGIDDYITCDIQL
jgi:hypothetical protein